MLTKPRATTLEISALRLGKRKMTALAEKAKRLGVSPARYLKQLVEEDLAIESEARSKTLAEIMAPIREEFHESGMTEDELGSIVDAARSRRRLRSSGRK